MIGEAWSLQNLRLYTLKSTLEYLNKKHSTLRSKKTALAWLNINENPHGEQKEKGEDTEFLIELASGSNGGRSPRHGRTQMKKSKTGGPSPSPR